MMARIGTCRVPLLLMLLLLMLQPLTTEAFAFLSYEAHTRVSVVCRVSPDDVVFPPSAEGALRSAGMARTLRKQRANRGIMSKPERKSQRTRRKTEHEESSSPQVADKSSEGSIARMPAMELSYESTFQALRTYHSHNGDLVIPRRFVVPKHKDYPTEWHGIDISSHVYSMQWWQRHVRQNPDRVAELNKLGFVWERLQPEWNLVLEALVAYKSIHGDLLVPTTFVVPHGSDDYAKATWGIPLGSCVVRIRSRLDFLRGTNAISRRQQLDGLGFVWDVGEHRFQKFYSALHCYVTLEQKTSLDGIVGKRPVRVPSTFVIPSHKEWPRELWDYPLGAKCTAVRQKQLYVKNHPSRQKILGELGFYLGGNASLGWLEVVHAAAIYSQMNNRNLDVPFHFVVPAPPQINEESEIIGSDDAWPWPEYLWGLPLGQRLKDIRVKGAYLNGSEASARRAQLDALGFNWTPRRGRRRRVQTSD